MKSSIPKRVRAYLKILNDEWETHKIAEKFKQINKSFQELGATSQNAIALNNLDKQITDMMLHAEKSAPT